MERILLVTISVPAQVETILRRELQLSTRMIRQLKRIPGGITLDGIPARVTDNARPGQELRLLLQTGEEASETIRPVPGPFDIAYEDDDLLLVNKPAGTPVHPSPGHYGDSLANYAAWQFAQRGEQLVFRPVNRLDRGTSGLLCIAKNAHAQARLSQQLHTGAFERIYYAVVCGAPSPAAGTIDLPIGRTPGSVLKRQVDPQGAHAVTHYETIRGNGEYTLLKIRLETGRTHQIRVHFAHLGCPLFGDFLYGTERRDVVEGHALHSGEIRLLHPISGEEIRCSIPLPSYMENLLDNCNAN